MRTAATPLASSSCWTCTGKYLWDKQSHVNISRESVNWGARAYCHGSSSHLAQEAGGGNFFCKQPMRDRQMALPTELLCLPCCVDDVLGPRLDKPTAPALSEESPAHRTAAASPLCVIHVHQWSSPPLMPCITSADLLCWKRQIPRL